MKDAVIYQVKTSYYIEVPETKEFYRLENTSLAPMRVVSEDWKRLIFACGGEIEKIRARRILIRLNLNGDKLRYAEPARAVFRVFEGDVIALVPDVSSFSGGEGLCAVYAITGAQMARSTSYAELMARSSAASESQQKAALERLGRQPPYLRLKPVKRFLTDRDSV